MLNQILSEIENAQGPVTLQALSHKLQIDPAALEGMLQFWVRKGRIQDDDSESCNIGPGTCGPTCSGTTDCAFLAKMPRTYSIPVSTIGKKIERGS